MINVNKIIKDLLKNKSIFLNAKQPFTWASGIKSPIYCDLRMINSFPILRNYIEDKMVVMIKEKFSNVDYIVGTSTAGISHAAIISYKMKLPMAYVRSSVKDHGRKRNIEGYIPEKAKVVVIEDLMSTGKSSIEVVNILRGEGYNVLGIASIFNYNLEMAKINLKDNKVVNYSLANFNDLIKYALHIKYITKQEYSQLTIFQQNPQSDKWMKN